MPNSDAKRLIDVTVIEESDCATCAFPQQIDPVEDSPTVA
jgi:hypothetical protein